MSDTEPVITFAQRAMDAAFIMDGVMERMEVLSEEFRYGQSNMERNVATSLRKAQMELKYAQNLLTLIAENEFEPLS